MGDMRDVVAGGGTREAAAARDALEARRDALDVAMLGVEEEANDTWSLREKEDHCASGIIGSA